MPELSKEQWSNWEENGYLVLPHLFLHEQLDAVNELIDRLWASRDAGASSSIVTDVFIPTEREQRLYFRDAPDEARLQPYKLNDLYLDYGQIRQVILAERLSRIVAELFDGAPLVCNSLNLEYGSQQEAHMDTLYMPSRVRDKMLASWIALEPAGEGNGPLTLYPGSHRIPPYLFSHGRTNSIAAEMPDYFDYIRKQIAHHGIRPVPFHAERGDVLLWHSQLLHGGSAIRDPGSTRRSLVTHYFRRRDYLHRFWKIRRHQAGAYYYRKSTVLANSSV